MEKFKELSEIIKPDPRGINMCALTGRHLELEKTHNQLKKISLNDCSPYEIKDQFNIARNMALYCYFMYSLAPEVQLKTYTIIEFSLRIRAEKEKIFLESKRKPTLYNLLQIAIKKSWIRDSGFRHIKEPKESNPFSKSLTEHLPHLRNHQAHGSTLLTGDYLHHICVCADFVNQIFPEETSSNIDETIKPSKIYSK